MKRLGWVLVVLAGAGVAYVLGGLLLGSLGMDIHWTGLHRSDTAHVASKPVSLAGTYGVQEGAVLAPVLKVSEAKGGGYAFTERETGEWLDDPETPHVATEGEVERALGLTGPATFYVYGLTTSRAMLLHVPAGWSGQGVETKTGFLLVSAGRLAPAGKVEMGGR